jgi:PST family polysaccharide transporter
VPLIATRAVTFYAAAAVNVALPLVTVPYLARVLGPAGWGELAVGQAVAAMVAALVEYGHGQSGTRALLRQPDPDGRGRIATEILAGKLLLGVVGSALACLLSVAGVLRLPSELLGAALAAGAASGATPLWIAQAGGRVERFLLLDVALKAAGSALVLVLVGGPEQAGRVLWLQAAAATGSLVLGLLTSPIRPGRVRVEPASVVRLLHAQRHGFLVRAVILTYTSANPVVLNLVATAHQVGLYAAADKLVRLIACFSGPLGQALYPALARDVQADPARARRLAARATLGVAAVGAALSLGILLWAEPLVALALGGSFHDAATALRIMAPMPLLICISNILGIQWMFSIGAERAFVRVLAGAGLICLATGALLGATSGAAGMAVAATAAEVVVTLGVVVHLARVGSLPVAPGIRERAHAH